MKSDVYRAKLIVGWPAAAAGQGAAAGNLRSQFDNWTCIRETTGATVTRYYAPFGELLTFERGGVTYQVLSDALGSVRVVTDNTGTVKARLDYDPFGGLLPTSTDSVPGGMPYRFVGAAGVRWDSATGLIYMRERRYDGTLQRFISRDPLGQSASQNLYSYCGSEPISHIDPRGLITTSFDDEFDTPGGPWSVRRYRVATTCECPANSVPTGASYELLNSSNRNKYKSLPGAIRNYGFSPALYNIEVSNGKVYVGQNFYTNPPAPKEPRTKLPSPEEIAALNRFKSGAWDSISLVVGQCWCQPCDGSPPFEGNLKSIDGASFPMVLDRWS